MPRPAISAISKRHPILGCSFALCGPFEIVAAAARSDPQGASPCPARRGAHAGAGGLRRRPGLYRVGRRTPGRNTATILQGRFSAPGTWPGRSCGRRARKKARPQRACRAWPCLFFWAAQAAQTFARRALREHQHGPAARVARPPRAGGVGGATRHRPCAAGLPGVWMAARHRCRARHRIVTGGCLARYLRPLGPQGRGGGWGRGPKAGGPRLAALSASL